MNSADKMKTRKYGRGNYKQGLPLVGEIVAIYGS
jgi:hypothetical protein